MSDQITSDTTETIQNEGTGVRELRRRRDIVQANIDEIGWSWAVLADRTGIPYRDCLAFKALKRDFPDSYVVWTGDLARAVAAIPRPAPDAVQGRVVEPAPQPLRAAPQAARNDEVTGESAVAAYQEKVLQTFIARYVWVGEQPDMTDAEKDVARGAITTLMRDLGLFERGVALMREQHPELFAPPAQRATQQQGMIGTLPLRPAA